MFPVLTASRFSALGFFGIDFLPNPLLMAALFIPTVDSDTVDLGGGTNLKAIAALSVLEAATGLMAVLSHFIPEFSGTGTFSKVNDVLSAMS